MHDGPSDRSRGVALALAILLGMFGGHRFYVGKRGTALLMLLTLGGAGLWLVYDLVLIVAGAFRDADGRRLLLWESEAEMVTSLGFPSQMSEDIESLRAELAELQERVDFTERLLAAPERARPLQAPHTTPV